MLGIKWGNFSLNHIISFDDSNASGTPTQQQVSCEHCKSLHVLLHRRMSRPYNSIPFVCQFQGEAEQATMRCIEACRIDEVFSDSKFLRAESLVEFVKSIIWASSMNSSTYPGYVSADSDDTDTAEVCLELLIGITIRNRDRIELLWPLVHSHLEAVIKQGTHPASSLVERAVLGLLRVCQRLLPYKEEIADELLRSLHLIFKLEPKAAEDLAVVITGEVLGMVKSSATYIKSEWGWNTVCTLLKAASHHPGAFPMAFEALCVITGEGHLTADNFAPCLQTAMGFIDNHVQHDTAEQATQASHAVRLPQ